MARKAFLLGRNTGSLRHCLSYDQTGKLLKCDIYLMQEALIKHDYQIILPDQNATAGHVSDQLDDIIDNCAQEDTFIFYFSGHSKTNQGVYNLVLGKDTNKNKNLYSSTTLLQQIRRCKAGSKLLILDCCESGKSVYQWIPPNEDNFRVLTATDRTSLAKEFDELQAGVFTYHFHRALTESILWVSDDQGLVDEQGTIWVSKLSKWLRNAIANYTKQQNRKAPEPVLHGPDNQDIALAKKLPLHHSFISPDLELRLRHLLQDATLPDDKIQAIFDQCLAQIQLRTNQLPACGKGNLECLLKYLIELGHLQAADIQVPLFEFIYCLSDETCHATNLKNWLKDACASLELEKEYFSKLGQTKYVKNNKNKIIPYLIIEIAEKNRVQNSYQMRSWLVENIENPHEIMSIDEGMSLKEIENLIDNIYEKVNYFIREKTAILEIFLPTTLLCETTPERWKFKNTSQPQDSPLAFHQPLVIRCQERMRGDDFLLSGWYERWDEWKKHLFQAPDKNNMQWVNCRTKLCPSDIDEGIIFFVLNYPAEQSCLSRLLGAGVAIALWSNIALSADVKKELKKHLQLKCQSIEELPVTINKVRRKIWDKTYNAYSAMSDKQQPELTQPPLPHTGQFNLLWDDPTRDPSKWEQDDLVNPYITPENNYANCA